jgi:Uma2 family endonuclease
MTVAARQIDPEAWSQARYLAWLESQPEGRHFEFDGARPVAMAPATVGHNRVGRNIREAIRRKLPAGPCDVYGPQDAIETVGGALREPDAFISCSAPPNNTVIVPLPVVVIEVLSPGRENRRRDLEEKVDEYGSVPSMLRYVIIESERRGYEVFWRKPGEREWRRGAPETIVAISVPEFGFDLSLDEIYAGAAQA